MQQMKARLVMVALIFAMAITGVTAQQSGTAAALLEAARQKETVEGDLAGAIKQYQALVDRFAKADRAVAASALVRMAECYQKLGQSQSHALYERVVREYADQTSAVTLARARLNSTPEATRTADTTLRKLWAGSQVDTGGTVSPDGRFLSYVDWDTGDLAIHEFATAANRRLTNKGPWTRSDEYAERSVISRDGTKVVYSWFNGKDRYELRSLDLKPSGMSESRRVFDNADIAWLAPLDWSKDGRWVAVSLARMDRSTQIGLVDVHHGSLRTLKSVDWRGATTMFFSPDGKYLAFDLPAGNEIGDKPDVFVMATDGTSETPVAPSPGRDIAMGWSPDGTRLLFSSDRAGTTDLWAQRFEAGRPHGSPELMKSDIGQGSLGLSAAGSLFIGSEVGDLDIYVASVDFKTGKILSPPTRPARNFIGSNRLPAWSPDGKYLSYISIRNRTGRNRVLVVQSAETGDAHEVPTPLATFYSLQWAPNSESLVVQGITLKGRQGLYRINARTGETTPIVLSETGQFFDSPRYSPDGAKLYYVRRESGDAAFIERDLAGGTEREIIRRDSLGGIHLSPDGKHIATRHNLPDKSSAVLLIPVFGGGEPRTLLRVHEPQFIQTIQGWTRDGTHVIASPTQLPQNDEEKKLLLIPVNGGPPRSFELPGFRQGEISVHPDGRRVAFFAGKFAAEVWVLENFLPALTAKK